MQRMNACYRFAWVVFRAIFRCYFRWRVFNPERVPLSGGAVLAVNHASYIDPPLVAAGLRRTVACLAREDLFRFPPMAWVLRQWGVVPLDRDGGSASGLRVIITRLHEGNAIVLFPEGTRTRDGQMQPARSGIGLIVIKSDQPVVPVRVFGTYEAYGRHVFVPMPRPIAVKYGEPMRFERLRAEAKTAPKARLKAIYQEVADELLQSIARLEPCEDKTAFP
jgi:1-acyl-sn-glycerol-3-phosphate acyltransferase